MIPVKYYAKKTTEVNQGDYKLFVICQVITDKSLYDSNSDYKYPWYFENNSPEKLG